MKRYDQVFKELRSDKKKKSHHKWNLLNILFIVYSYFITITLSDHDNNKGLETIATQYLPLPH